MGSAWLDHVKNTMKSHPGLRLKEVLKIAAKSYKKGSGSKTQKKHRRKSHKSRRKTRRKSHKKRKKRRGRKRNSRGRFR